MREKGKPIKVTDTFPGVEGVATLSIKNGDDSGKCRVTSEVVRVNDEELVTPDSFNQQCSNFPSCGSLREDS